MSSNFTEFFVQLWDVRLGQPIDDDTGFFCVLQAAVPLKQTSYSDSNGTALTQPATMTNGVIQFWVASGTTTVDLSVMTAGGKSYFLEGVTPSQHRIDVDPYREHYTLVGSWAVLTSHADTVVSAVFAPQSGGLPAGIKIKDVYVHKTQSLTAIGAVGIDFGVSGDQDAFIDNMTATVTGYFLNDVVVAADTEGGSIVAAAQIRGAKLLDFQTGVSGLTGGISAAVPGWASKKSYMISLVTTTNNLVFAVMGTSQSAAATGRGYVFYEYDILPTVGN